VYQKRCGFSFPKNNEKLICYFPKKIKHLKAKMNVEVYATLMQQYFSVIFICILNGGRPILECHAFVFVLDKSKRSAMCATEKQSTTL